MLGWIAENESNFLKGKKSPIADQTATCHAFHELVTVLETDFYDEEAEKVDPETQHVAGYAAAKVSRGLSKEAHSIKLCNGCVAFFVLEKGGEIIDNTYHSYLQRGGLVVATPLACLIANYIEVS